jgi:hypothetical protein
MYIYLYLATHELSFTLSLQFKSLSLKAIQPSSNQIPLPVRHPLDKAVSFMLSSPK